MVPLHLTIDDTHGPDQKVLAPKEFPSIATVLGETPSIDKNRRPNNLPFEPSHDILELLKDFHDDSPAPKQEEMLPACLQPSAASAKVEGLSAEEQDFQAMLAGLHGKPVSKNPATNTNANFYLRARKL